MSMTIPQRAGMFRSAAEQTESAAAARMYLDTANVLLTLSHQYHSLSVAVRDAYTRRDQRRGKPDPAWQCIGAILEIQHGWEAATQMAGPAQPRPEKGGWHKSRTRAKPDECAGTDASTGASEGGAE